jgi:hypothetical protein
VTHEYPPNRAFDSVSISRVAALRDYGLTRRQREFLVTVMVHSGCFLERQYCEFTGTVRGQNSREFVARLVAGGFARAVESGPVRRGRLYHVHHKPLYEAIGQADNRNRRLRTIGRMVERVMILDAVLGDRRCWWLSPEADGSIGDFSAVVGLGGNVSGGTRPRLSPRRLLLIDPSRVSVRARSSAIDSQRCAFSTSVR